MKQPLLFQNAKWIWTGNQAKPNEYGEFYSSFTFSGEETHLLISADSNYAVYLNGALCAFGQYADYPYDKVYDDVDITPFCRDGHNRLAILVWYYGIDTTQVYYRGEAGLIFEVVTAAGSLVHSSEETASRMSRAYRNHADKQITRQIGFSYHYDATAEDGWREGALDGFSESVAAAIDAPLRPRPCERLTLGAPREARMIKELAPCRYLYDLGVNTVGFLSIEVASDTRQTLVISYGEHIADGSVRRVIGDRDFSVEVTVGEGQTTYLNPFRRLGCRYLEVQSEAPLAVKSIGIAPTEYPLTRKPRPKLTEIENEIYDICERTLVLCMHEHYEDCPWREQALYAMDSRNQMLYGYYAFGETRFPRASLELMAKDRRPDGLLSMCYPMKKDMVIPSFSLHYFLACAEYLRYSGDKAFLEEIYPKLESVLDVFLTHTDETGLIAPFCGRECWNFYEWKPFLSGNDPALGDAPHLVMNALMSLALGCMAEISDALGKDHAYHEKKKAWNTAIRTAFYMPEEGLFRNHRNTQTASVLGNALAVLCGAADTEARNICERMRSDRSLTPISLSMRCFLYDALLKVDYEVYAPFILADIERVYRPMVEMRVGTVWETEDGAGAFGGAGSLCHGWSAMPIYYYHLIKGN